MIFNTPLHQRWANFFTLANWKFRYDSYYGTFVVTFPCGHSDCIPNHALRVTIIPRADRATLEEFQRGRTNQYAQPNEAVFGSDPQHTLWDMTHGEGSGVYSVGDWVENADDLWRRA